MGSQYAQAKYDRVACSYDDLYSRHVAIPNGRLTRGLRLLPGERLADLACGTGVHTIEMARSVAPATVVGVDLSEGMLAAAKERAFAEGVYLTLVRARAEHFVDSCAPRSLEAISIRFALAYLDWQRMLPRIGRVLVPGGRIGILTSLSTSIPQLYQLFLRYRGSVEPAWKLFHYTGRSLTETLRLFRGLREAFADGAFITLPDSPEAISNCLVRGGMTTEEVWTDRVRIWFSSPVEMIAWMHSSGYVTHASLERVGPDAVRFLDALFADGLEEFREKLGIPLDLVMCGVIARK